MAGEERQGLGDRVVDGLALAKLPVAGVAGIGDGQGGKWAALDAPAERSSRRGSDQPTRIGRSDDAGNPSGWIDVLGADPSYRPPPPPDRSARPVACFYVCRASAAPPGKREYHRAVYVTRRTIDEFSARVARKWNVDPSRILRAVRILDRGLVVEMDDDDIRELKEGQDMMLDIAEVIPPAPPPPHPVKREWDMAVDAPPAEEGNPPISPATRAGYYELRLTF